MSGPEATIPRVRALVELELQLLNLAIEVCQHGRVDLGGEVLECTLPEKVRAVVAMMSMAAGQSVGTALKFASERGIPVRDCFPVARTAIEGFVNASYVLAGGEVVAEKAIRHAQQKVYRALKKDVGRGKYKIQLQFRPVPDLQGFDALKKALDEFSNSRGYGKSWTDESVPVRIEKVGEALGAASAGALIGAYALVYEDASEIVHGSLYGVQLFFLGRGKPPDSVEEFQAITARFVEGIMLAVFLALNGYLHAFCASQKFEEVTKQLNGLFLEFMEIVRDEGTAERGTAH